MAHEPLAMVLRHLRRWVGGGTGEAESDGNLLERFAATHDQAAFATLMQRHGPLVLSVCRRLLADPHAVDDAFQATFVVLVRRAAALKREGSLGSWLYTVAYRIALKARAQSARRRSREQQAEDMAQEATAAGGDPDSRMFQSEIRAVLDDEVHRLPEKYRAPLILCYLEGKTNEQAARELGCPIGSMSWRLDKGRELLKSRLASRGVTLSVAALATALTENAASAAVPVLLSESTMRAAVGLLAGKAAASVMSANVASLADGFLHTFWVAKVRAATIMVVMLGLAGSGATALAYMARQADREATTLAVATMVDRRIEDFQPTPAERKIDQIGWARDIRDALRLAKENGRPVFLFTHVGKINTGRCGGSAFGVRANSLADDRVIALLNRHFVPVYSNNDDVGADGTAPAEEKAERWRIYHDALNVKMTIGDDCVYILTPDGKPFDSLRIRTARSADELIGRLEDAVRKLGTPAGEPLVKPGPQSLPPAVDSGALVLHLVARINHRKAWGEFPAENWIMLNPEECRRLVLPGAEKVGAAWEIDPGLASRILSHFFPQTENYNPDQNRIDRYFLAGRVLSIHDGVARVRLDGSLRMKHQFYPNREDSNFVDTTLIGYLEFDLNERLVRSLRLVTDQASYGDKEFAATLHSLP